MSGNKHDAPTPAIRGRPVKPRQSTLLGPSIARAVDRRPCDRIRALIAEGGRPWIAKSADRPIEQSTTFELVTNLKAARGARPFRAESLLARADEVIE